KCGKMRWLTGKRDVGSKFALEHLAGKKQPLAFFAEAYRIADQRASQRRSELGCKIAYLIGVRHEHQARLFLLYQLLQRRHCAIGGVPGQLGRVNRIDLRQFLAGDFVGDTADAAAEHCGLHRPSGLCGDALGGSYGLPGNPVQLAFTLFNNYEDCVCHFYFLERFFLCTPTAISDMAITTSRPKSSRMKKFPARMSQST